MLQYNNKKVAILGLSVEGIDSTIFFSKQHAEVTCCDRRTKEELGSAYAALQLHGPRFSTRIELSIRSRSF
jgi:UDP-N-acetylmuramoylalanine-D-glutamate ligase